MLRIVFSILLFIISISLFGQTIGDLIRISQNQYINTARSAGAAGSFGSLGADISVANLNPAGIAEFRKSEFVIGGNYATNKFTGSIDGTSNTGSENKFQLGSIAGVFTSEPTNFDIKTMNIAVGVNQLASFQDNFTYGGSGPGTRVRRFLEVAQGFRLDELDPFEGGPAFDAEAILDSDVEGNYRSGDFTDLDNQVITRSETVERSGTLNEVFFTMASNRKNKFSWGFTLGIPIVKFEEFKSYSEVDAADNVTFFNNLNFNQELDISGAGINIKAGLIYKLTPKLRIGLALHSPTIYAISENYSTNITYDFTFDGQTSTLAGDSGPAIPFDYQINTPWRAIGGLSYLYKIGDLRGFVSGDVEYVDYSSAGFSVSADTAPGNEAYLQGLTDEVPSVATSALNFRAGTEIAYKYFRVRLGASMQSSPYINQASLDPSLGYSAGLGYRGDKFYVDVAYTQRSFSQDYRPYRLVQSNLEPVAGIESKHGTISFTVGVKI